MENNPHYKGSQKKKEKYSVKIPDWENNTVLEFSKIFVMPNSCASKVN